MRIQHNIMAMGAYRNYTNNVNALKKNLEKLSSGYKINRAGDDAAGLAISEKMRAQITGLETAQKNAKDGISLVQTAEGALTEVHDMLNRMVTLATQSANGTYDDTTDRVQLQKEVDQLKDEINRIADSANFNGIKLLDGSLSSEKTTIPGSALINLGTKEAARFIAAGGGTAAPVGMSKLSTVLHQDATTGGKSSFEIDLDGCGFDSVVSTAVGVSVAITVGGVKMTMAAVTGKTKVDGADLAGALDDVGEVSIGGISYSVTAEGSKLKFEMTEASFAKATIAGSFSGNLGVTIGIGTANSGVMANGGDINYSTVNIKEGGKPAGVILANTVQQTGFASSDIKDKLTLQIGNEAYIFALTDETFDQATAVANTAQPDGITYKVVDVRDLVNPNTSGANSALKTGNDVLSNALTRLTVVAKDNDMFSVGLQADAANPKLTFQEKSTYSGDADLSHVTNSTGNALEDQFKLYKNAGFNVTTPTVSKEGKSLTLQIGDTADTFNQLEVNVKDCHVASLGLGSIDISKQDSALAAIDKIKAAINTVSDVRGTLGATQNRLDHTINNLSVMTENIQDAESTIRDTDVAAEMMEYTKNNILIQSAQAMLAQANQVPQGVLQLLQ